MKSIHRPRWGSFAEHWLRPARFLLLATVLTGSVSSLAAQENAVIDLIDPASAETFSAAEAAGFSYGFEFTVGDEPLALAGLGMLDLERDGLNTSVQVSIWRHDGLLIGTTIVPSGVQAPLDGYYRKREFVSYPILDANTTYVVAVFNPSEAFLRSTATTPANFQLHPGVVSTSLRRISGVTATTFPTATPYAGTGNTANLAPNVFLKSPLELAEELIELLQSEIESLEVQLKQARLDLAACQKEKEVILKQLALAQRELTATQQELATALAKINSFAKQIDSLQRQLNATLAQLTQTQLQLQASNAENAKLTQQLKLQQLQIAQLQQNLSATTAALAEAQAQLATCAAQFEAIESATSAFAAAMAAEFGEGFVLAGETEAEKLTALFEAIAGLNPGQRQALFDQLMGTKSPNPGKKK